MPLVAPPVWPLPNPTPRAWRALGPGAAYPCDARDRRQVGKRVPGRGGGRIVGCATPPEGARGGAWLLEGGGLITKSRARDRRREHKGGTLTAADRAGLELFASAWERGETDVPAPIGKEIPHRAGRSRCDPEHSAWSGYADAVARGELDPSHPDWDFWQGLTDQCVRGFVSRERARAPRAGESGTRAAARARAGALRAGVDPTSAEYLDTLAPSSRAKALRRLGRLTEARALERAIRAGRPRSRR